MGGPSGLGFSPQKFTNGLYGVWLQGGFCTIFLRKAYDSQTNSFFLFSVLSFFSFSFHFLLGALSGFFHGGHLGGTRDLLGGTCPPGSPLLHYWYSPLCGPLRIDSHSDSSLICASFFHCTHVHSNKSSRLTVRPAEFEWLMWERW